MSKDDVKRMFGKLEKDAALKGKYADLLKAHQKDAENKMAEKLIEFGKTSGFAFSKDDLLAARSELADNSNLNKELSAEDLNNVAGGDIVKASAVVCSVFGLGVACAVASVVHEVYRAGCAKGMTTSDPDCKNT